MVMPLKLYKYEPFNKYSLSNLKNQQVYFSRPNTFNDPFDCSVNCNFEDLSNTDLIKLHRRYFDLCPDKVQFSTKYGSTPNSAFRQFMTATIKVAFEHHKNEILFNRGVSCFSETNSEILMWSHYANSHQGFCLEFDTSS